ncbi:hypothetical protein [Pseudomonas bohemica]|uniref:hypothetical protein n=1 Tax=Pseudomonas bohemica TaxID=2044872 RepID=UPI0018FE7A9A|nr:hypothetical protein [Pseudomonas bohemica]
MQPKNTTAPPPTQERQKIAYGSALGNASVGMGETDLGCFFSPMFLRVVVLQNVQVCFRSDPLFEKALAVELLELLAPHFPSSQFRITQTGGITCEPAEFAKLVEDHVSRITQSRDAEQPGLAYLASSGSAPQNATSDNSGAIGGDQ